MASETEPDGLGVEDLRLAINDLQARLDKMGPPPSPLAEIVDSTNTLRTNEYLSAKDAVCAELLSHYGRYARMLESVVRDALDVQSGFLEVLRAQSELLEDGKPPARMRAAKAAKGRGKGRGSSGGGKKTAAASAGKRKTRGSPPAKRKVRTTTDPRPAAAGRPRAGRT
ncbi:MAG: hypothetical protein J4F28_03255 [Nitrosopumilaceae archaeon]|nr:hypothetical protein [Nitrosopumilaceae archaeon]